uniref:Uncharacterized protein n=1 Tax=Oryza meridionalis TaxID=40149 RepID=A0A0E0DLG8_9ORYZ
FWKKKAGESGVGGVEELEVHVAGRLAGGAQQLRDTKISGVVSDLVDGKGSSRLADVPSSRPLEPLPFTGLLPDSSRGVPHVKERDAGLVGRFCLVKIRRLPALSESCGERSSRGIAVRLITSTPVGAIPFLKALSLCSPFVRVKTLFQFSDRCCLRLGCFLPPWRLHLEDPTLHYRLSPSLGFVHKKSELLL